MKQPDLCIALINRRPETAADYAGRRFLLFIGCKRSRKERKMPGWVKVYKAGILFNSVVAKPFSRKQIFAAFSFISYKKSSVHTKSDNFAASQITMLLNKYIILERLKKIKPELSARYTLSELALFGSYARSEQTSDSDIDIMINLSEATYNNLCNVVYTLRGLFPDAKVEVVSRGAIKPKYFAFVKPDLVYA